MASRKHPYTEAELALFARYREHRAAIRPLVCNGDPALCWVEQGPSGITMASSKSLCRGCGANVSQKEGAGPGYRWATPE